MEKKLTMSKWFLFLFMIVIFMSIGRVKIRAENQITMSDGNLFFVTYDTKASSTIRWRTVGFTITTKKCLGKTGNGGYPAKYQHTKIYLKDTQRISENLSDGRIKNTFTIPESEVTKALIEGGFSDTLRDGGTIYLNGIFRVTKNGADITGNIDNLNEIKKAQAWRNPDDFEDRFDIKVTYKAALQSVKVVYLTTKGAKIHEATLAKSYWKKPGDTFSYTLYETKNYNGEKYCLEESYFIFNNDPEQEYLYKSLDYGYTLSEVKNVTSTMRLGGVTIYAILEKEGKDVVVKPEEENISFSNESDVRLKAAIKAEEKGSEKYHVKIAIPSGEKVYALTKTEKYIYDGEYEKVTGTKVYPITIKKKYTLKWDGGSRDVVLSKKINVTRSYEFWKLKNVSLHFINYMDVANNAVEDGVITITNTYKNKKCDYEAYTTHIQAPEYSDEYVLESEVIVGGKDEPVMPTLDYKSYAEKAVGKIKVRNDLLVIGGKTFTSDEWKSEKSNTPSIPDFTYYTLLPLEERDVVIPVNKVNGVYKSTGKAYYNKMFSYKSDTVHSAQVIAKDIEDVNGIRVHTPVVCDAKISNDIAFCQEINPDLTRASLILGREFFVNLSNEGNHISQRGYYYNDYSRYVKKNRVRFPFDVYLSGEYIKENTWIDMVNNSDVQFYLPTWVKEGDYTIEFMSVAVNAGNIKKADKNYNELYTENTAVDTVNVRVSGRIYGFNVYDVSDYPLWQNVFRVEDSIELSGVHYSAGVYDENGNEKNIDEKLTVPFVNGSHLFYENKGILKPGYTLRMSVDTIGKMYSEDDYVQIVPKFRFMREDGVSVDVDVYYNETFTTKQGNRVENRLIKIGSYLDSQNIKRLSLNDTMLGVDPKEIENTAYCKGKSVYGYGAQKNDIFTFGQIMVNSNMQIFNGMDYHKNKLLDVPEWIESKEVERSCQRWYFEYYIPSDIHIVEKGTDIGKNIDFSDDIWLKKGYLIMNFEIKTIQDRSFYLDYKNDFNSTMYGCCNMWNVEGMVRKKTDYLGNQFLVEPGDIAWFNISKSVSTDYVSGGTH